MARALEVYRRTLSAARFDDAHSTRVVRGLHRNVDSFTKHQRMAAFARTMRVAAEATRITHKRETNSPLRLGVLEAALEQLVTRVVSSNVVKGADPFQMLDRWAEIEDAVTDAAQQLANEISDANVAFHSGSIAVQFGLFGLNRLGRKLGSARDAAKKEFQKAMSSVTVQPLAVVVASK